MFRGGGCCDQVPCPGPGGGGVVTWSMVTHLPPPRVGQTDACENITFARYATRAVISEGGKFFLIMLHCNVVRNSKGTQISRINRNEHTLAPLVVRVFKSAYLGICMNKLTKNRTTTFTSLQKLSVAQFTHVSA